MLIVSGPVMNMLCSVAQLIPTGSNYFHSHFTGEKTEALRSNCLFIVVNVRLEFESKSTIKTRRLDCPSVWNSTSDGV